MATVLVAAFLANDSDLPSEFSPAQVTAAPRVVRRKSSQAGVFAWLTGGRRLSGRRRVRRWWRLSLVDLLLLIEMVVVDLAHRPAA